jgi:hypothetical protein
MGELFASVNGAPLVGMHLCIPREGVWHGHLAADADAPLDFGLQININGLVFRATAHLSTLASGTAVARFVGGAGGLHRDVPAKSYNNVPLSIPLSDILSAAGETLEAHSNRDVTTLQLRAWSTTTTSAGIALNTLLRVGAAALEDVVWRIQPNGKLWVGIETWEEGESGTWEAGGEGHELLEDDAIADRAVLYMERPAILPGTTFRGRRVNYVEHTVKDARLRTTVWLE